MQFIRIRSPARKYHCSNVVVVVIVVVNVHSQIAGVYRSLIQKFDIPHTILSLCLSRFHFAFGICVILVLCPVHARWRVAAAGLSRVKIIPKVAVNTLRALA